MRYRKEERTRWVPKTINGKTHNVEEKYTEDVPQLPRDMDASIIKVVTRAVCVVIVGAITWSTVSIGALLSEAAPAWAAYLVAGVFDLAWVVCMAVEWLARFDPQRAKTPKVAGWVALAVSMSAIFAHGWMAASWVVGATGALVSALAKGLWFVVMKFHAVELDPSTKAWVEAERSEVNGQRALFAVQRQLNRSRQAMADEEVALRFGRPTLEVEQAEQPASTPSEQPSSTEQPARPVLVQTEQHPSTPRLTGHEQPSTPLAGMSTAPSMAELARELLAQGASKEVAAARIMAAVPNAKPDSVKAEVRRQLRKLEQGGGYL